MPGQWQVTRLTLLLDEAACSKAASWLRCTVKSLRWAYLFTRVVS